MSTEYDSHKGAQVSRARVFPSNCPRTVPGLARQHLVLIKFVECATAQRHMGARADVSAGGGET